MTTHRRGLEVVFTMFLGIVLTAFIIFGMFTFYPAPAHYADDITALWDARRDLLDGRSVVDLDETTRAQLREIDDERNELIAKENEATEAWGRVCGLVLIVLSTVVMAVALLLPERLPVISSGMLLAGVFTMVYGTGWTVAMGTAITRFLVLTFALIVTFVLGYLRFVRRQPQTTLAIQRTDNEAQYLDELRQRLDAVEKRLNELDHPPN